jgi:hypothetical protein
VCVRVHLGVRGRVLASVYMCCMRACSVCLCVCVAGWVGACVCVCVSLCARVSVCVCVCVVNMQHGIVHMTSAFNLSPGSK